ncbi:MAG: transcription-repair coupling factor [Gammaproteobacteria bacterium]
MNYLKASLPNDKQPIKHWGQLYGCARGLIINDAVQQHDGLVVVLTADSLSSTVTYNETKFFNQNNTDFLSFPEWETLPYDIFSPHEDIVSDRITTLHRLPQLTHGVLVLPISTCMQRVAPKNFISEISLHIKIGDILELDDLRRSLASAGYHHVSQVVTRGEFTIRGSIVDFFPMGSNHPYRLEFFDNEVETIRTFDPEKQTSLIKLTEISLLPAHEFPSDQQAIKEFRRRYREKIEGDPNKSIIYKEVSNGNFPPGIEYYLPLFFDKTSTLFDYLPENTLFVLHENALDVTEEFESELYSRYEQRRHDIERPILTPKEIYLSADETKEKIEQFLRVQLNSNKYQNTQDDIFTNYPSSTLPAINIDSRLEDPAMQLRQFIQSKDRTIVFAAESLGRREYINETLRSLDIKPTTQENWQTFTESNEVINLLVAPIDDSVDLPEHGVTIIAERQLFGNRARQTNKRKRTRDADAIVRNLNDLTEDAPVVHEDHGVGRYKGLQSLNIQGLETEFLTLEYMGGDKLYVPVANLHLVSRYTGANNESAPWHKLGSDLWSKVKQKAAEKARDVAAELLDVYARREAKQGIHYDISMHDYVTFSSSFPFEETPDQQTAIESVLADMDSTKPMDRVVCGDVGFGKTEVAMRAAFIAVNNGKQVAVLVPTTLLAQQHYQTFQDRFAEWPIQIESLSRFSSAKKQKETITSLEEGKLDIVIGTHKLFSADIKYKNLGLIIIDEEQRFGVRHKEKLKALRAEADILTLTATPIPRTLNMSLSGLRDLSIIATPPTHRHAIKTFVSEWNDANIKEACTREIKRGGQIYFLHNEVKTIEKVTRELQELLPNASIRFAHGQMSERELEQVMLDFYHTRFSILVATTIIESGLDVPTANTIIINRADKLGLSQLHQLRGRVGRSHHRAYAYMITPHRKAMSADAVKRLDAIESLEELGVGFTLATHDLEIRGAGELLGEGQSGQIHEIGYTMYNELLSRAVRALKSGDLPQLDRPLDHGLEVDLGEPALLPEDYVPDVHMRLVLYKRIASAPDETELRELQTEFIDRFGLLPDQAKNLFLTTELKLFAGSLGINKIEAHEDGGRILFDKNPKIDIDQLLLLLQRQSSVFKMSGSEKLLFTVNLTTIENRIEYIRNIINTIVLKEAA